MSMPAAFDDWLSSAQAPEGVVEVLTVLGRTCAEISTVVAGGALTGVLGASGVVNVQDEEQKKLDLITNDMLTEALLACPVVAGVASEEMDNSQAAGHLTGEWLVLFDPLDGSSNIDINAPVGNTLVLDRHIVAAEADHARAAAAVVGVQGRGLQLAHRCRLLHRAFCTRPEPPLSRCLRDSSAGKPHLAPSANPAGFFPASVVLRGPFA